MSGAGVADRGLGVAAGVRELQPDEEIAVGVGAELLAVRGDERLAQRRRSRPASPASAPADWGWRGRRAGRRPPRRPRSASRR